MYLQKMRNVNTGPIDDLVIEFPFVDEKPAPVVLVGENGTGKSEVLSFIVDSFYEMAGEAFIDVRQTNEKQGYQYYKAITPTEIKIPNKYMYSYIEYKSQDKADAIGYFLKCGNLSIDIFKRDSGFSLSDRVSWEQNGNAKRVLIDKKKAQDIFNRSIFCSFAPNRYEMPIWMGEKYYNALRSEHISIKPRWADNLGRPITVQNTAHDTLSWLLDIIVDSRCDVEQKNAGFSIVHTNISDLVLLKQARTNVEQIMSAILGEEVFFGLNNRGETNSRFNIRRKSDDSILAPAFESLSTGQLALFNMFATIVRYSDWNNINSSIRLKEIHGIVVIDEVELHIHADLQRNVLPKLLKLFPNVQFVLSSHSPLFLLGMDEQYGENGYRIIEMPSGAIISSEAYSQFQTAYTYFSETRKHHEEIVKAISSKTGKPLIVTEGATDWKHMKAALVRLKEANPQKYERLDFEFLEYEPKNAESDAYLKLEMGKDRLLEMCRSYSAIKQARPIIFVADADDKKIRDALSEDRADYKVWGNNVYSLVIPVPQHRKNTPNICIEHYYTDEEIKTTLNINNILRRLYMGCEFDKDGISLDHNYICMDRNSCGPEKINVIDGSSNKRVRNIHGEADVNLALSKMDFANAVLAGKNGFDQFDLSSFETLYDVIGIILSQFSLDGE